MKIKLSKSQWEQMGKAAGWMKKAQENAADASMQEFLQDMEETYGELQNDAKRDMNGQNDDTIRFTHVFRQPNGQPSYAPSTSLSVDVEYSLSGFEKASRICFDKKLSWGNYFENESIDIFMNEAKVKISKNGKDVTKDEDGNWNEKVIEILAHLVTNANRAISNAKSDAEADNAWDSHHGGPHMTSDEAYREQNYMELKDKRPIESKKIIKIKLGQSIGKQDEQIKTSGILNETVKHLVEEELQYKQHNSDIPEINEPDYEEPGDNFVRGLSAKEYQESLIDPEIEILYAGNQKIKIYFVGNNPPSSVNAGTPKKVWIDTVGIELLDEIKMEAESLGLPVDVSEKTEQAYNKYKNNTLAKNIDKMIIESKKKKSPKQHGFIEQCIKENKDKKDPGAYCASIVDKVKGTTNWRKKASSEDDNVSRRRSVKVTMDDGDVIYSDINGTKKEIVDYYTKNNFTKSDETTFHKGIKVEFLK